MIALGVMLALAFGAGARLAARLGAPDESRATRALRAGLGAFGSIVVVEAVVGACGWLTTAGIALGLAGGVAVVLIVCRRGPPRAWRPPAEALTAADGALGAALGAALALRLAAGLHKTTFLYDTLSYHLHTPATWLADHRLTIVPAVFGDPSPAYAPSNLELWFVFLMAPLHADYLAGSGQLPFAALAALAVAATVREAGGRRSAALGAALAFLLIPEVWQQTRTAMTDLGMAALLLAALPFVVRLRRAPAPTDLATAAVALGLAIGTKYAALPLAIPFGLAVAGAAGRRGLRGRELGIAAAVVVATGGFWYVRNTLLTGNPFYPVAFLGRPSLYDGALMRAWDYHVPAGDLRVLGAMLAAAGGGFGLAALAAFARLRPAWEAALTAALVIVFWLVVPYQESRFLFAAFGVAAVAIGRAAARPPVALGWGALLLATGGALFESASPERLALFPAAALGALAALGWRRLSPARRPTGTVATAAAALVLLSALAIAFHRDRGRDPGYAVGDAIDDDWTWFRRHVSGARVAYTGTNLAFPLTGIDLSNRVAYVNVAGAPDDRLHDFGRRAGLGRAATPEPAPYRDGADANRWLQNLEATHTDVLFVAALDPIVGRTVAADADGFPVERAWADARPRRFRLLHASPAARVYQVVRP